MFNPPSSKGNPPGGSAADPITIHFGGDMETRSDGVGLRTTGSFSLGLTVEAGAIEPIVTVSVDCFPVDDEGVDMDDPIGVQIFAATDSYPLPVTNGAKSKVTQLRAAEEVRFVYESDVYPADWTTRVDVKVKEVINE